MTKDEADTLRTCVWMIDLLDEDVKTALRISHGRPVAMWIQTALEIINEAEEEGQ